MDLCTITGTVFDNFGVAAPGVELSIIRVEKNSELISTERKELVSGDAGAISFQLPRASTAWIYSRIVGLNRNYPHGTRVYIPNAASADLSDILPPVQGPPPDTFVFAFNGRTGNVTLTSADIATALGYTPSAGAPPTTLNNALISVVWGSPAAESGNAIEIAASCLDFSGAAFASGLVDVKLIVSDAANDGEPSHTAVITAASVPVGTILSGSGTATVIVRTDSNGNFKIKVTETAAASRYLWTTTGGHSRLWVRSSTGVQQLTFA